MEQLLESEKARGCSPTSPRCEDWNYRDAAAAPSRKTNVRK
jgi:hypothetical protein